MAIDKDKASESLFNFKRPVPKEIEEEPPKHHEKIETSSNHALKAKWKDLESVTVLLDPGQKDALNDIVRKLLKHRASFTRGAEKERITVNMLIRCLIDAFLEKKDSIPLEVLTNEQEVKKWIKSINLQKGE